MTAPIDRAALIAARILAGDDIGLDRDERTEWTDAAQRFQDGDEADLRRLLARCDAWAEYLGMLWRTNQHNSDDPEPDFDTYFERRLAREKTA